MNWSNLVYNYIFHSSVAWIWLVIREVINGIPYQLFKKQWNSDLFSLVSFRHCNHLLVHFYLVLEKQCNLFWSFRDLERNFLLHKIWSEKPALAKFLPLYNSRGSLYHYFVLFGQSVNRNCVSQCLFLFFGGRGEGLSHTRNISTTVFVTRKFHFSMFFDLHTYNSRPFSQ